MFPGETLPQVKSPLDKNDHPELDNSELANEDLITKFMCMIGQLLWAVTLGRSCWKHPSPFSNVHFRNSTKIAVQVLALNFFVIFTFEPFLKLSLSQTMTFSFIFVFASSFFHMDLSIVQTQHP